MHFLSEAEFVRPRDDDDAAIARVSNGSTKPTTRIRGYFHARPVHVSESHEPQLLNISAMISELNNAMEQFTCHGSGYALTCVTKLTVVMVPLTRLAALLTYRRPVESQLNMLSSM